MRGVDAAASPDAAQGTSPGDLPLPTNLSKCVLGFRVVWPNFGNPWAGTFNLGPCGNDLTVSVTFKGDVLVEAWLKLSRSVLPGWGRDSHPFFSSQTR